ncbi:hypothetical protein GEMRC1_002005 [Eukaryota sp. GEM-RC1]
MASTTALSVLQLLRKTFPEDIELASSDSSSSLISLLHKHVTDNNLVSVSAILDFLSSHFASASDTIIDSQDFSGMTPLHIATIRGYDQIVVLLLQANADPSVFDNDGMTCLHYAAADGRTCIVRELICSDRVPIFITDRSDNEETPLHHATRNSHLGAITELLISNGNGHDIDTPNSLGQTALHLACLECNVATVRVLLHHGASVDASDNNLRQPLHYAAFQGCTEVVKLLVENEAMIDVPDLNSITPIALAAGCPEGYDALKYLIDIHTSDTGPLPNITGFSSDTSSCNVSNAVWSDSTQPTEKLPVHDEPSTSESVTDSFTDSERKFNLMKGDDEGKGAILQQLLSLVDFSGASVLRYATISGNLDSVKLLINYGADPTFFESCLDSDSVSKIAVVPLAAAAEMGHYEIVKYLVEEVKCDKSLVDFNECSAAHYAAIGDVCDQHFITTTKPESSVRQHFVKISNSYLKLKCSSLRCSLRCLFYLHRRGMSFDHPDNEGMLPLHMACGKDVLVSLPSSSLLELRLTVRMRLEIQRWVLLL